MNRSVSLTCLVLAIGIAGLATVLQWPALWDVGAVSAFQGGGALRNAMEAITTLGSQAFLAPVVLLVFWCINKLLGVDMALLLVITGVTNVTLKTLLQNPRPFWSEPALQLTSGTSFTTPSGHAAHATVLFGYLAWWIVAGRPQQEQPRARPLRGPVAALLLLGVYLISLSRVYLGVHFPGDVIWGCTEGIVVLIAYIGLRPRLASRLGRLSLGTHAGLAAGAAAAVLLLNLLFLARPYGSPSVAQAGLPYAQARSGAASEAGDLAGLVLGIWIGLALEQRCLRFATSGPPGQRALRYGVGLAGVLAIGLGLPSFFPAEPPALNLSVRVAGAAAAALWALFAWPWLFVRMGLGVTQHPTFRVGGPGN